MGRTLRMGRTLLMRRSAILAAGLVLLLTVPASGARPATLQASFDHAQVGQSITVKGKRFPKRSAGDLTFDGRLLASISTDRRGTFKSSFVTPSDQPGPHALSATVGAATVSAPFAIDEPLPTLWPPRPKTSWQIQFSGDIDLSVDAAVYDLDGFETTAGQVTTLHDAGRSAVCYVNAGGWENWRPDKDAFPSAALGKPLDGWPGERWFDIRHQGIRAPLEARMDMCAAKGFDGIEYDNVDGYTNDTGFPLTAADQLAFDTWLANAARARGLEAGLKNNLDQIPDLVNDFDFAVNEQCVQYDECDALTPFVAANKAVFHIEYNQPASRVCPISEELQLSTVFKKLELGAQRSIC